MDKPALDEAFLVASYGALEGRARAVGDDGRGNSPLTLDRLEGQGSVVCYPGMDQLESVRSAWGQTVRVVGRIARDSQTATPVVVTDVATIEPLRPMPPGAFRRARGVVPASPGTPLPEERIRHLRDAGG